MLGRKILVVPREQQRWGLELEGKLRPKTYPTRESAIEAARSVARDEGIALFVRLEDGETVRLDDGLPPVAGEEGAPTYWQ